MNAPIRFIVATGNPHKVQEIRSILGSAGQVSSWRDLEGAPELREDSNTFAGNAIKKAVTLAHWLETHWPLSPGTGDGSGGYVLADDSGLEVDALEGAPGVHSARFAGLNEGAGGPASGNATEEANNAKLLRLLASVPAERRSARFRCVLALVALGASPAKRTPRLFEGICEGRIALQSAGEGGFGYDPLFFPMGYNRSFAQLGQDVKNTLSHRARALAALKNWLSG